MCQPAEILGIFFLLLFRIIKEKEIKGKATNLFCKVLTLHFYN